MAIIIICVICQFQVVSGIKYCALLNIILFLSIYLYNLLITITQFCIKPNLYLNKTPCHKLAGHIFWLCFPDLIYKEKNKIWKNFIKIFMLFFFIIKHCFIMVNYRPCDCLCYFVPVASI